MIAGQSLMERCPGTINSLYLNDTVMSCCRCISVFLWKIKNYECTLKSGAVNYHTISKSITQIEFISLAKIHNSHTRVNLAAEPKKLTCVFPCVKNKCFALKPTSNLKLLMRQR